ncbi:hypothetical protein Pan216_22710 [Planctomycetes bacterium Pan216]|uniref:VWFA domain-containing protein n=1 Tax=Kolteria novifilia TaxID=2527975 RepID=A0A518B362_9BACT|nr:hypothetical protein Pan216_22710 [Planctomycetes bacterium Pan216]
MNLTSPSALGWLALALPIVILYVLKIRMRRVPVSTVLFWQQIFDEHQPRSLWQKLRHLLSLLVQLAFLALLVLALTKPYFPWESTAARRVALIVDNSASMNATDVAPDRLGQAKTIGQGIIDALRHRDEMTIITAGTAPRVACGLTGHQRTLRGALADIEATDGPTRVAEAVTLARRLIGDRDQGEIILLSDGCFEDDEEIIGAEDLQFVSIGKATDNVGITQLQVRRSLGDPIGYEILTQVSNLGESEVSCRLEIDLNEEIVDVVPLTLAPGETWSRVFEKTSALGGRLVARLNHTDRFAPDNQAYAVLPDRPPQEVFLVAKDNLFLQKVLEAHPVVRLSLAERPPETVPPGAVLVLHRHAGNTLPTGNVLVIEPGGSTPLWTLGETLSNPIVVKEERSSPLLRHVRLNNVLMPEARRLEPLTDADVLVESVSGDPLYLTFDRGDEGKALVLTVNLDKGDLPLRTAFPILVTNALHWFAGDQGELRESLTTGSLTEIPIPSTEAATWNLVDPRGEELALSIADGKATIGPLDHAGIWTVRPSSIESAEDEKRVEPARMIACNLASKRESDLRVPRASLDESALLRAGWGGRPLWFYLVVLAWLLVTAEWWLYQRRWIG